MSKRVLFIDNVPGHSGCSVLAKAGYAVDVAPTTDVGLQQLHTRRHDVIIIQERPDAESWQLCEKIRRVSTRPLIVISPEASVETSAKTLKAGADYFLRKPFGSLEFSARVASLLRRESLSRSAASLSPS